MWFPPHSKVWNAQQTHQARRNSRFFVFAILHLISEIGSGFWVTEIVDLHHPDSFTDSKCAGKIFILWPGWVKLHNPTTWRHLLSFEVTKLLRNMKFIDQNPVAKRVNYFLHLRCLYQSLNCKIHKILVVVSPENVYQRINFWKLMRHILWKYVSFGANFVLQSRGN